MDAGQEQGLPDVTEEEMEQAARLFQAYTRNVPAIAELLRTTVPELGDELEAQRDVWLRKGAVLLFSGVFAPHLVRLITMETDEPALQRAFNFVERLAVYPDEDVASAAMLGIHVIAALPDMFILERARRSMGPIARGLLEKYASELSADAPGTTLHHKRRFDSLPFGPDMRPDAYPTVAQLYRGAILWTIAEAVFCAGSMMPGYERGWHGSTYWLNNYSGARGAVEFGDEGVVACFFERDSDRNPRGLRHAYEPRRYIAGMPERLKRLAERTAFGFVLDDWRGQTLPLITASCWSEGERLMAPESWERLMEHGGSLIAGHVLEMPEILDVIGENYDFSPRQLVVVRSLFRRRMKSSGDPVVVTPQEQLTIVREGTASFDQSLDAIRHEMPAGQDIPAEVATPPSVEPTRDLLAQIGIIWPGPPFADDAGDGPPPPYRPAAVPAITQEEILERLDDINRRSAAEHDANALELMLAFTDCQADANLLFARYRDTASKAMLDAFANFRARYYRPSGQ